MAEATAPTGPRTVPQLITDLDTDHISVMVDNIELTSTIGPMDLKIFFDAEGRPIGEWVSIQVLNRGRALWDSSKFQQDAPALGGSAENLSSLMFPSGSKDPKAYYVGFSFYEPCPVLVRPPRANSTPKEGTMGDSFSGCDFKSEPKGQMTGSSTIVNASVAVSGNLTALKQSMWLIEGKGFANAFAGADLREIKYQAENSLKALAKGNKTVAVQKTAPFERGSDGNKNILAPAKPIDSRKLRDPSQPKSVRNPSLADTMPNGKIFILRNKNHPQGFIYYAPLTANMVYPDELLVVLIGFIRDHPQDSMSLRRTVQAAQLYADIMGSPGHQQELMLAEKSPKPKGAQVPRCTLEEFLLGFELWLRFHEEHQLLEFIHPCRFIRGLSDSEKQQSDFLPRSRLDAPKIIELLGQATTKWAALGPETRCPMFPFSMTGSNIAWPSGLSKSFEHSDYMMALLNFDNIYSYGRPSFNQQGDNKLINIAMPRIVAETRLGPKGVPIPQAELQGLFQPGSAGPKPLFGTMKALGPVWKPIPLPALEPSNNQPPVTDRVALLTEFPFQFRMSEGTANLLRQGIMAVLENLSQEGRLKLKPNERLEMKANLIPEMVNIPKTNFQTICAAPPMTIFPQPENKDQDTSIVISLATLSNLVSALDNHSTPLPTAWKGAQNRLRDLGKEGAPRNQRTHSHVLRIIKEARVAADQDKAALESLSESLEADPTAILEPAIGKVYIYVCRLIGIVPGDGEEWDDLEDQVSEVYRDLHTPVDLIMKNIKKAAKDTPKANGWGMKAQKFLEEILNIPAIKDLEGLMKKEEDWIQQAVIGIAAGTRGQSKEPNDGSSA